MVWTINRKITFIVTAFAICFSALTITLIFVTNISKENLVEARKVEQVLMQTQEMRVSMSRLILAAMDSIIDKDEGKITDERMVTINKASKVLDDGFKVIKSFVENNNLKSTDIDLNKMMSNIDAVENVIRVDLENALRSGGGEESFARLDDVIDASGEGTMDDLSALIRIIEEYDETRIHMIQKSFNKIENGSLIGALMALIIGLSVSFLIIKSIVNPLNGLRSSMEDMSKGDYSKEVPATDRNDEIGEMAQTVLVFKKNGIEAEELREKQENNKKRAEEDKRRAMKNLSDRFDKEVGAIVDDMIDGSSEMEMLSKSMTGLAENSNHSSVTISAAVEEANANVQAVAEATESLSAASTEISNQISEVASKSRNAADNAKSTDALIKVLNGLAEGIGEVVESIKDVADQTNLLALNATIEAARAGDAGKGFAVVAEEVKNLAGETNRKTVEIEERIGGIQDASANVVEAMHSIIGYIDEINQATAGVAGAVEEQSATTQEVGANIQEAAKGTGEVSSNIISVQGAVKETMESSTSVFESAQKLSSQGRSLKDAVNSFTKEMNNAA